MGPVGRGMAAAVVISPTGLVRLRRVDGGAGGGEGAGEEEAGEGAVDVAAGADALDDLLTEVAAFGEVEGVGLGGLLREVAGFFGVADVDAVAGGAGEDAEVFEGFGGDGSCAGGGEGFGEGGDGGGVGPEFEAGDEGGVGVDDFDGRGVPDD